MVYDNTPEPGVLKLWKNDRKTSDKHANLTGHGLVVCPHCDARTPVWANAWINLVQQGKREGEKWVKVSLRPKDEDRGRSKTEADDPF